MNRLKGKQWVVHAHIIVNAALQLILVADVRKKQLVLVADAWNQHGTCNMLRCALSICQIRRVKDLVK